MQKPSKREIIPEKVRAALVDLEDPGHRADLVDALIVEERIREGRGKTIPWEEVRHKPGSKDLVRACDNA